MESHALSRTEGGGGGDLGIIFKVFGRNGRIEGLVVSMLGGRPGGWPGAQWDIFNFSGRFSPNFQ